ncbi:hypothetical protein M1N67_02685 [Peptococcaceae bacterium]|nr:hypothetical protein [Peptococcaceae bacterium]
MVLHGLAGVGKTRVLQMLSKRNVPVLDLESIAAHRVERIKEDYLKTDANIEQLKHSISLLKKRLGVKKIEELNKKLELGSVDEVFEYLLSKYYDPLYNYPDSKSTGYDLCVNCENLDTAAERIYAFLRKLLNYRDVNA